MYYMITAEHMNAAKVDDVAQTVEDTKLGYVIASGMDATFTGFANLLVETTDAELKTIKELFWNKNGGAMCQAKKLDIEQVEEYL
jgi:hypothetical protein